MKMSFDSVNTQDIKTKVFPWHSLNSTEIFEKLQTNPQLGLSEETVNARLSQHGLNQLTERSRPSFIKLVLDQLNNFVVILLVVASIISLILGEYIDAGAILAIVVLNSILGVVQESRAEAALAALQKLASPEAKVLRNGKLFNVPSRLLVPGDIVMLETGNFIPADLFLFDAINLQIDEAALTGESVPVQKISGISLEQEIPLGDRKNSAFMGTTISYGRGRGVVISTGMHTQLGMIAEMLQSVESEETPLQRKLDQLGKILGTGALLVCGLVFLIGIMQALKQLGFNQLFQPGVGLETLVDLFMVAISLAIAAVPEGLPAVVTISLALGMREMVRRHALIRRLASVETLGSATVICSDKTGTLTQNEMTVTHLWVDNQTIEVSGSGYSRVGQLSLDNNPVDINKMPGLGTLLWIGVLNNDATLETDGNFDNLKMVGDPTEGSLLVAASKTETFSNTLNTSYPRIKEIPFDSERKRMVTIHQVKTQTDEDPSPIYKSRNYCEYVITVKGAPDVVLDQCNFYQTETDEVVPLNKEIKQKILIANDFLTEKALRVLGFAYRLTNLLPENLNSAEVEQDLIFVGMAGMIDPARFEVEEALCHASRAGIRTIMITGDFPKTAQAIAEQIGLLKAGHQVLTGPQISSMSDVELAKTVSTTDVFARVNPEHKMRIVDALKAQGEIVAMTGDGVNDAPAIKRADIGVAMGISGTDVAKETADMVLTDDNYASIVSAIEQGRIIYSNIRKFVYYLVSCNMAEIATIFFSTLFGWGSPLTAIQLLWLNLITDGAPALALATEKGDPDIMYQKPRPAKEPIINKRMQVGIFVQTIAITLATLSAFMIGKSSATHNAYAETMAFVTLSCSELLRAYTARSEYFPILKIGVFKNRIMNYAVLSSLALILAVIYIPFLQPIFQTEPLGIHQWIVIAPLILIPSVAAEIFKSVSTIKFKNDLQVLIH